MTNCHCACTTKVAVNSCVKERLEGLYLSICYKLEAYSRTWTSTIKLHSSRWEKTGLPPTSACSTSLEIITTLSWSRRAARQQAR